MINKHGCIHQQKEEVSTKWVYKTFYIFTLRLKGSSYMSILKFKRDEITIHSLHLIQGSKLEIKINGYRMRHRNIFSYQIKFTIMFKICL